MSRPRRSRSTTPTVVATVAARYPSVDKNNIKVGIAHHSDAYGQGLYDTLSPLLTATEADAGVSIHLTEYNYGPSGSPVLGVVTDIVNDAPDIVFLFGFNEGPDIIFAQVESQWKTVGDGGAAGHKPYWIFSDGGEVGSLWASSTSPVMAADINSDDLRQRVSGTVPGENATSWAPYGTFLTEFNASSYSSDGSADTIGPAGAYDILFLLAYSTVMVGGNPVTGPNLVKYGLSQMQKKTGLPMIKINRDNILNTFPQLTTGMPINVTGVSGPLLFNGMGDLTTADIQIWCVPPATSGPDVGTAAINSGFYFDSTTNALQGCAGFATACSFTSAPACP